MPKLIRFQFYSILLHVDWNARILKVVCHRPPDEGMKGIVHYDSLLSEAIATAIKIAATST